MPDLPNAHIGIADDISGLNISGGLHTLADYLAGFAKFVVAQFFVIDRWNFDVDINAVKQWTRDALWSLRQK